MAFILKRNEKDSSLKGFFFFFFASLSRLPVGKRLRRAVGLREWGGGCCRKREIDVTPTQQLLTF